MKVQLLVDDVIVYQHDDLVTPPVTPPPPVPPPVVVPPETPPVTPPGTPWVWDSYPTFNLNSGDERVYIVNINTNYTYLKMSISGLSINTMGTFTWTFPDGRILPVDGQRQGVREIAGMNGQGLLVLRAVNNIPDNPIPRGSHVLRISASGTLGNYFKVSLEVA